MERRLTPILKGYNIAPMKQETEVRSPPEVKEKVRRKVVKDLGFLLDMDPDQGQTTYPGSEDTWLRVSQWSPAQEN